MGNPDGCEWWVYEGPLFIDFRLPAAWRVEREDPGRPVTPAQVVVGDLGRMATEPVVAAMELSLAGEDGHDAGTEILQRAFPVVAAAIEKLQDSDEKLAIEGVMPEVALREALHGELVRRLQASWRRAQLAKKTDELAVLARQMDVPLALARRYTTLARDPQANGADAPTSGENDARHPASAARAAEDGASADGARALFAVSNHHTAACGAPPAADGDAAETYVGYFANEYGAQAVYTYEYRTGAATLRMGDVGWHETRRVVQGQAEGLRLTNSEALWLRACWLATGERRDRPTRGPAGPSRRC